MAGILSLPNADVLIYLAETYAVEEDFERWNVNGWTENENGSGTLTVPSSVAAKRQNYGMRSDIPASAGRHSGSIYKTFTNTSNDPVYANFWFRINSTDLSSDDAQILFWATSGLSVVGYLEVVESGGELYLNIKDYDGTSYSGSASPLTIGTWYHIRCALKNHTSAGVAYLEVNGTVLINETPTMADDLTIAALYFGIDNLYMTGDYAMNADFDEVYAGLAQISINIEPDDEAILNIHLHLGCTNEVSSFEIVIDRGNPTYDQTMDPGEANALSTGLECDIYLGRGTNAPLLLTGQIDEIEYIDELEDFSFRNVVIIRGRCNGYQLFGKHFNGDLLSLVGVAALNYNRTSGDASSIVAYLIDNYTSLQHVRVQDLMGANANISQKNVTVTDGTKFTAEQLVKIEDDNGWEYNRIDSISTHVLTMYNNLTRNYTTADNGKVWVDLIENTGDSDAVAPTAFTELMYTNTVIFDIIKYIAEIVDLDDVIGFDTRIEYDGKFAFFSKNSKSESYTLQDECQLNRYLKDANRIKNKITVYGKAEKPHPLTSANQPFGNTTPYDDSWTDLAIPFNKTHLAGNAASGQKDVDVNAGDGANFSADDWVFICDDTGTPRGELIQIASVATDKLTMKTNLVNAWATADNSILFEVSPSGGWGFLPIGATDDITISAESTIKNVGSRSVKVLGNNAINSYLILMPLLAATRFSTDDYPTIKVLIYGSTTSVESFRVTLWSGTLGSTEYASSQLNQVNSSDEWVEGEFDVSRNNANNMIVGSTFDWTDIGMIEVRVYYAAAGTNTFYIDCLHAFGKRWGGGTDDATVDGYAENTSSQTTYGIRELVIINDLLLSDTECENKAQALIDFYSDERLVIEVDSRNIDWATYHPMAGNKVAVDLDQLGVTGSSYRIDSIDIVFRGVDNNLSAIFTLDNTPLKLADYLYKLSERIRLLERNYKTIR